MLVNLKLCVCVCWGGGGGGGGRKALIKQYCEKQNVIGSARIVTMFKLSMRSSTKTRKPLFYQRRALKSWS